MVDDLKNIYRAGFTFDIETTGLDPSINRIYSIAMAKFGDKTPNEKFFYKKSNRGAIFDLPTNTSEFSLKTWEKLSGQYVNSHQSTFLDTLKDLNKMMDKSPIVVGHNLGFDFRFIMDEFNNHYIDNDDVKNEIAKIQGRINKNGISINTKPEDLMKEDTSLSLHDAKTKLYDYDVMTDTFNESKGKRFGLYLNSGFREGETATSFLERMSTNVKTALESAVDGKYTKATVVDTFSLARAANEALQLPEKLTYGNIDLHITDTGKIGLKLEYLAQALGIDTSKLAHTGEDVIYNQPVAKSIIDNADVLSKLDSGNFDIGNLSKEGKSFALYMNFLSYAGDGSHSINNANGKVNLLSILDDHIKSLKGMSADDINKFGNYRDMVLDLNLEEQIRGSIEKAARQYASGEIKSGIDFKVSFRDNRPRDLFTQTDEFIEDIHNVYKDTHSVNTISSLVTDILDSPDFLENFAENDYTGMAEAMGKRTSEIKEATGTFYKAAARNSAVLAGITPGETNAFLETTEDISKSFSSGTKRMLLGAAALVAGASLFSYGSSGGKYKKEADIDESPVYANSSFDTILPAGPSSINYSNLDRTSQNFYIRRRPQEPFAGIGLEMSKHLTNHYFM